MWVLKIIRKWAKGLKEQVLMLWFVARHEQTPPLAKALAVFTAAYALSPIDLIPDFIPVLGFLDDAILLPGLIWLVLRMVPPEVKAACRARAQEHVRAGRRRPTSRIGAAAIIALWVLAAVAGWLAFRAYWPH
jgi:uncharacterized membrane protein YkvA (DUF1232 family)